MNKTAILSTGLWLAAIIGVGASGAVSAQEFAALVSPPRYELFGEPGQVSRQVLEITHMGTQTTPYRVFTADWTLAPDGSVSFFEPLQSGSCRPWVALERRELSLSAKAKRRFRFEVTIPPDAAPGECRFAVMIEGDELKVKAGDSVSFPAAARIGVVVYMTIGKGAPVLEIAGAVVDKVAGQLTPMLQIRNIGNAHGRLSGILDVTDAAGAKFEMSPATLPILPGETRDIVLSAVPEDKIAQSARFPLTVKGNLEWADKKTAINQVFKAPANPVKLCTDACVAEEADVKQP